MCVERTRPLSLRLPQLGAVALPHCRTSEFVAAVVVMSALVQA